MNLKSKLNRNIYGGDSQSLRATVPAGIVAFLGVEEHDELLWRMEFVGDERVAFVTKKKTDG